MIDVSLPSNAEIITKCVSILKEMSEFINSEKKKEEKKETTPLKNLNQEESKQEDVVMF